MTLSTTRSKVPQLCFTKILSPAEQKKKNDSTCIPNIVQIIVSYRLNFNHIVGFEIARLLV